jgi:Bacterial mobilisation protein (MobC)
MAVGALSPAPQARPVGRVNRAREAEPRDVYKQVTLTATELGQLQERAAGLGVSIPRLLVESALSGVETPAARRAWIAELFELRRLVATIANNVNQLARTANISGELPTAERMSMTLADVDEILAALRELTGARR